MDADPGLQAAASHLFHAQLPRLKCRLEIGILDDLAQRLYAIIRQAVAAARRRGGHADSP